MGVKSPGERFFLKAIGRRLTTGPVIIALLGVGIMPAALAQAGAGPDQTVEPKRRVRLFNIPAQPLVDALRSYSEVTGFQVICESRLSHGRRSKPVVGLYTPETALRILLDGSPLTIRYSGPQDITLAMLGSDPLLGGAQLDGSGNAGVMVLDTLHVDVAVGAERRPDFSEYGMTVRSAVRSALMRDPGTARRIYDLQIDVFVGRGGRLYDPHFVSSTEIPSLDASIARVLKSIVIGMDPPEGLPQPIRIAMVSF